MNSNGEMDGLRTDEHEALERLKEKQLSATGVGMFLLAVATAIAELDKNRRQKFLERLSFHFFQMKKEHPAYPHLSDGEREDTEELCRLLQTMVEQFGEVRDRFE